MNLMFFLFYRNSTLFAGSLLTLFLTRVTRGTHYNTVYPVDKIVSCILKDLFIPYTLGDGSFLTALISTNMSNLSLSQVPFSCHTALRQVKGKP